MTTFVERLIGLHRRLDRDIRRELARVAPDTLRLATLKKRKLVIKDRLARTRTRAVHT